MAGRDINEERLRLLAQRLGQQSVIERVDPFPSEKLDRVIAHLEPTVYPDHIDTVRIEIRLHHNGEFNVQYFEEWPGEQWTCRWDRHENPHSSRDHFHPPPTIDGQRARDCTHPETIDDVIKAVLAFVEQRIGDLWDESEITYPDEYEYTGEYDSG